MKDIKKFVLNFPNTSPVVDIDMKTGDVIIKGNRFSFKILDHLGVNVMEFTNFNNGDVVVKRGEPETGVFMGYAPDNNTHGLVYWLDSFTGGPQAEVVPLVDLARA